MGSSHWSDDFYRDREAVRSSTGATAFVYDAAVASGEAKREVHAQMEPKGVTRESRDSEAHPNSKPVAIMFDVTGSMGSVPRILQARLPQLMGLLVRKSYVPDPQVLIGGVGDFFSDQGPIQVGQFESGIEIDDDLGKMWLEGGGGGSMEESYQDAMYFFSRHTSTDAWEKRQQKGYLFLIGDEKPYSKMTRAEAKAIFGDDLDRDLTVEEIVAECQEKWNVFFILPKGTSYWNRSEIHDRWAKLLGEENFLRLEDPEAICELIGVTVGRCEGTVNVDKALEDLTSEGTGDHIVRAVKNAVGTTDTTKSHVRL
jgi:hypothetical protein